MGRDLVRAAACWSALLTLFMATADAARAQPTQAPGCRGDCDGDGAVSVNELVRGVNIALDLQPLAQCISLDGNGDMRVSVDELIAAVRNALVGCVPTPTPPTPPSASVTPTPTETITPTATSSATTGPPLNFLVINLDDVRADGIDRMPVLQSRLIGEGVRFVNAFTPNALCCPSRASLLSGLYSLHHGTKTLFEPLGGANTFRTSGADRQTIAVWLQAAGYRNGLFGKYLNEYANTAADPEPNGSFYVPPGWTRWRAMMSQEHYGGQSGPTYRLIDENGRRLVYNDHTNDEQYSTDLLARELRAFIAETVSAGQPFFAVWAPYAAHIDLPGFLPVPAVRHQGLFDDLAPWRPPNWNEADVGDKPAWLQALPMNPFTENLTDRMRRAAYETLLAVDEQLALILDQLATLGVDGHTVIILTSDNGVSWGEHRLFAQGKECPYEECLRVPLIVRAPGRILDAPATRQAAVLNIDVAPTLAALAGVPVPVPVDGESFAGWLVSAPPERWRDHFLIEHWRGGRDALLTYTGQVTDGDRARLLHGDPWATPRAMTVFEFDDGGGIGDGAIAVDIGPDADTSFANLGEAVIATVGLTGFSHSAAANQLVIADQSPRHDGVYWLIDRDQAGVIVPPAVLPDHFGVRDVADNYTYVEHETGEVELYDLDADPWQMENVANDPAHAAMRAALASQLAELLAAP